MTSSDCIRGWKLCDLTHPLTTWKPFTGNHLALDKCLIIFNSGLAKNLQIACRVTAWALRDVFVLVYEYASIHVSKRLHGQNCTGAHMHCGSSPFGCLNLLFLWTKKRQQQKFPPSWNESKTWARLLKWDKEFQGNLPFTVRQCEQLPYVDLKQRVPRDVDALFLVEDLLLFMFGLVFKQNKW